MLFRFKNLMLGALILSVTAGSFLRAETVERLSVDDLVRQVLEKNPELQAAEADLAIARGDRRASGQWKNPVISAEYGEKRVRERVGELGGKGSSQRYSVEQAFEFPRKASLRKAIADRNIELAELSLKQLRFEISAKARSLALGWIATREEAAAAREVADRSETLVQMLGKRAPAGVQSVLDQRIIEASLVNILNRAREAEEKQNSARIALNILRNEPVNSLVPLQASLMLPEDSKSWDALFDNLSANNLQVKSRQVEAVRSEKLLEQARLGSAPDFTIAPFMEKSVGNDKEQIVGVGISLPFPLWDSNRGQIDSARAAVTRTAAQKEHELRDMEGDLAKAHLTLSLVNQQIKKSPLDILQRLKEGADLADRQYRLGAIPVQTYLGMQEQYLEATGGLLDAIREAHDQSLRIRVMTADETLLFPVQERTKP